MSRPIYLDYHATTPVDPRVLERMLPFFTERFGNPASRQHAYGWEAQEAVDTARAQVAALIGASAGEIVFTSGASESNNLAIKGATCLLREKGDHIVTSAIEHKSVLDCFKNLESDGWRVSIWICTLLRSVFAPTPTAFRRHISHPCRRSYLSAKFRANEAVWPRRAMLDGSPCAVCSASVA